MRSRHLLAFNKRSPDTVEDGKICVKYIPTVDNVSDIFTKPLLKPKFQKLVELLGLRNKF